MSITLVPKLHFEQGRYQNWENMHTIEHFRTWAPNQLSRFWEFVFILIFITPYRQSIYNQPKKLPSHDGEYLAVKFLVGSKLEVSFFYDKFIYWTQITEHWTFIINKSYNIWTAYTVMP